MLGGTQYNGSSAGKVELAVFKRGDGFLFLRSRFLLRGGLTEDRRSVRFLFTFGILADDIASQLSEIGILGRAEINVGIIQTQVVNHHDGYAVIDAGVGADRLLAKINRGDSAAGDLRILILELEQQAVVGEKRILIAELFLNALNAFLAELGIRAGRIDDFGAVVGSGPFDGGAGGGILFGAVGGAALHAYFLTVIDEGVARHEQIQARRHLALAVGGKVCRGAAHIVIGEEGRVDRVGSGDELELIVPVLELSAESGAVLGFDGGGNDAGGIAERKIKEAVEGAVVVLLYDAVACPCLADRIEIGLLGFTVIRDSFKRLVVVVGIIGIEPDHRVKAEAVHALADPEIADFPDLFPDVLAVEIQLRHIVAEITLVIAGASRNLLVSFAVAPVVGISVFGDSRAVLFHFLGGNVGVILGVSGVIFAFHALFIPADQLRKCLEPLVLLGGVVEHHVDNHGYFALMALLDEVFKILHRAVHGIHRAVIRDVVFVIGGGGADRHEPEGVDAERSVGSRAGGGLEVVELLGNAVKIAVAVAVGVLEGAHEDLVEILVLVVEFDDGLIGHAGLFRLGNRLFLAAGDKHRQQGERGHADGAQLVFDFHGGSSFHIARDCLKRIDNPPAICLICFHYKAYSR